MTEFQIDIFCGETTFDIGQICTSLPILLKLNLYAIFVAVLEYDRNIFFPIILFLIVCLIKCIL